MILLIRTDKVQGLFYTMLDLKTLANEGRNDNMKVNMYYVFINKNSSYI